MSGRKEINKELLKQIDNFKFHNQMSVDEFADFFGLKRHKPRNWKNSPGAANPTPEDLRKIEAVQRSEKGKFQKYKLNIYSIITGFSETIQESELTSENTMLKQIIRERDRKIYELENEINESKSL